MPTALGDKGMAVYRNAVAERSAQGRLPFAVKHATERLAVLDGDVEAIISLVGQDLTSPHQYTRVAEAMLELERPDDALAGRKGASRQQADGRSNTSTTSLPVCTRRTGTWLLFSA